VLCGFLKIVHDPLPGIGYAGIDSSFHGIGDDLSGMHPHKAFGGEADQSLGDVQLVSRVAITVNIR